MEGLHASTLWDIVTDVFEVRPASGELSRQLKPKTFKSTQQSIDYVPHNTPESSNRAHSLIFKHNEAVIKMIIKGCNPHTRHVSWTHRGLVESIRIRTYKWNTSTRVRFQRQWDTEKPKLDAARRSRGFCYIESDDQEFDNVIKNAKTLEMPCNAQKVSEKKDIE